MSKKEQSERVLRETEAVLQKRLRRQTLDGLAKTFDELGMKGVGKEIRAGRNVRGNVAYGIKHGVHDKIGARYNVKTGKFIPMSAKAKRIELKFIMYANKLLELGGYKKLNSRKLVSELRRGDEAFKKRVQARRATEKKSSKPKGLRYV